MSVRHIHVLALAGMLCHASISANAQQLTLDEAVDRALASHPELRAFGAATSAAEQRARQNSLAPPFTVGAEVENIAGTGRLGGFRSAETTLRLGRVVELDGKREARRRLGRAEVSQARAAAERARIEVAAETTRRFIDVLAAQARISIAETELERTQQLGAEVSRWVETGRSPVSELHQSAIAAGLAELELEDAQHRLLSARVALATQWSRRSPDFTTVLGDLSTLPTPEPLEQFAARLPASAEQQRFDGELARFEAERDAARRSSTPDLSLTAGVRRLETFEDQALVFAITMPLGSTSRASIATARIDAELAAVDARRDAATNDAYRRLFATYQRLQHARHEFARYRDQLLPSAELAIASIRERYETGGTGFLALIQSRQQLSALRSRQIDAAVQYHTLLIDIEQLTAATGAY